MTTEELSNLVDTLAGWKAQEKDVKAAVKEVSTQLMGALRQHHKKSWQTHRARATMVEPTRVEIDEEALRAKLDDETWDRITRRVVDTSKLESAVTLGLIEPEVVAEVTRERQVSPYVRVTDR